METNSINQSQKIVGRMQIIDAEIEAHQKNIKLLINTINYKNFIEKTPFAPRIIKYSCIPISEKRCLWTLQNLRYQVKILETELETLIKYMMNEGAA